MNSLIRRSITGLVGKGPFAKGVSILAGGTLFSQLLGVLLLPVITRLYSPEDFSSFAAFASLVSFLSVIACWRLEIAIAVPRDNSQAQDLLAASLLASALTGTLLMIAFLCSRSALTTFFGHDAAAMFWWAVPAGVTLTGGYTALQLWASRQKNYGLVAKSRVMQSLSGGSVQVAAGGLGLGFSGLMAGQLINAAAGCLGLARGATAIATIARPSNWRRIVRTSVLFGRFPIYSVPESLANAGGMQLPIIAIAALAVGPEAGFVMLAARIMAVPMAFVGGSVSQVFLSEAAKARDEGRLAEVSIAAYRVLLRTGVGPLFAAGIVAPVLIPHVFGMEWQGAGDLILWMTPWFVLQFLSSPVSMTVHVLDRQKQMLLLSIFGLALRLGSVGVAYLYWPGSLGEAFAVSSAVFYSVCMTYFARLAGVDWMRLMSCLKEGWFAPALWLSLALLILLFNGRL